MSSVYIHLGQAGNQIGKELWRMAETEFVSNPGFSSSGALRKAGHFNHLMEGGDAMFHAEDGYSRYLAVDSEPKVVQSCQLEVHSLRPDNVIFDQGGLANNWAMGFRSCTKEGSLLDRCMEGARREIERCSWPNSIVIVHSLAGGTGSGLGSALLQALRDEYPSLYLINISVWALQAGETPLQHYNTALSLQHLQAFSDAVVYRSNDDLLQAGAGPRFELDLDGHLRQVVSSSPASGGRRLPPSMRTGDMNNSLASDLASYFFPTSYPLGTQAPPFGSMRGVNGGGSGMGMGVHAFDGGSLVSNVCPLPSAKFVDLRSTISILKTPHLPPRRRWGERKACQEAGLSPEWGKLARVLGKGTPLRP
ncbi:unnamed protein product, partial [Choristocarpus tenellus]